ncbi:hypothetical protein WCT80_18525 [Pectobacterium carotovorum]|uniref:hypothetical protein n=1 Tax=Pectobacterium carotovorum TaxID=554 RepID=UPI0030159660
MKTSIFALALLVPSLSQAAIQCGGYRLTGDGMTAINGETVTSQKVTFLGLHGDYSQMKTDMTLMPARDGFMYGFEFIKRDGKAFLNVELIRGNVDSPRFIGSFDCKKVPD